MINVSNKPNVTFDQLLAGLGNNVASNSKKSVRLHSDGRFKAHTGSDFASKIKGQEHRDRMRQRAFDTVKLSIQNQLGCDAAMADKIVDRVVDPKSDRISVAQMHNLKLVLNTKEEMGSLTRALLNGNGQEVTSSLDRMAQFITSAKTGRAAQNLPLDGFPELTQLVDNAKNGDTQNAKAIMDRLSNLVDQLDESNWGGPT